MIVLPSAVFFQRVALRSFDCSLRRQSPSQGETLYNGCLGLLSVERFAAKVYRYALKPMLAHNIPETVTKTQITAPPELRCFITSSKFIFTSNYASLEEATCSSCYHR